MANNLEKKVVIKILGDDTGFKKTASGLGGVAKGAAVAVTAAFAAATAGAIKSVGAFRDFEKQFTSVATLLDSSSFKTKTLTQGIDGLKKGVMNLRSETGESFENLNKGLFDLISAGVDAEKAVDALKTATKLARVGATSTSVAVDGLTSALNAYNFEADEADNISNKFFTAQKFGKTTIEQLSAGFGQVGSTAAAFGISLDEVLGSVSAVTLAGVRTSEAYTGLKAVFSNIAKPTKDAADEAARLGINFNQVALQEQGLVKFFQSITNSSRFNKESLTKLFGSVEALNVALALTGNQAGTFSDIVSELGDEAKIAATATDALNKVNKTLDQSLNEAAGAADVLFTKIGEKLAPKVIELTEEFKNFLETVTDEELQSIADGFAAIADVIVAASVAIKDLVAGYGELAQFNREFGAGLRDVVDNGVNDPFENAVADLYGGGSQKETIYGSQTLPKGNISIGGQSFPEDAENMSMPVEEDKDLADKAVEKIQQGLPASDEEFTAALDKKVEQDTQLSEKEEKAREKRIKDEKEFFKQMEDTAVGFFVGRLNNTESFNEKEFNATKRFHSDMQTLASSNIEALSAIGKAYQVADAIRNTYVAANKALAAYPPPLSFAMAAATVAAGLANVASITGAAEGTIVSGFDTGRDNKMMAVRSGEMILPPDLAVAAAPTIRDIIRNEDERGVTAAGSNSGGTVQVEFVGDAGRILREIERETNYAQGISQ